MKKIIHWSTVCLFIFGLVCTTMAQYVPLPPYPVENVQAEVIGNTVRLTWDEAEDQDGGVVIGYRIYYGTQSVTAENGNQYEDDVVVHSAQTEYEFTDLDSGTYYFAVTARDDEEWESDNYSHEVSATLEGTPSGTNVSDDRFPKVLNAQRVSAGTIQVEMSEPVQIESPLDGFFVQNRGTYDDVVIQRVDIDGAYVFLTVDESHLVEGEYYDVVATSFVEDLDSNPVASGITDTATFQAQAINQPVIEEPIEEDELFIEEEPVDTSETEDTVQVTPPMPDEVMTSPQEPLRESAPVRDTTPPYDATDMEVDSDSVFEDLYVTLSWDPSRDVDGDVVDQVLFIRLKGDEWDTGYSLGKDLDVIELDVELERDYEVKLVTIDNTGNESDGLEFSFDTYMPLAESGAGAYAVGVLVAGFVIFYSFMTVRKRNRLY